MNVEQISDLERRAGRFAALGDPVRLHIVDLLALGDRSPGWLREHLGVSSNLLAHHLGVLEQAQLVRRARSEGDRRRSYVRLEPSALEGLVIAAPVNAPRIVFVCTANSARSQLAAGLWRRASDVPVESAGTHPATRVAPGAVATAARHGLDVAGASPKSLDDVGLRDDDWIVTVCDSAHEHLPVGDAHWSVPDPVRVGTQAAFDAAFDDIARRVERLAATVEARPGGRADTAPNARTPIRNAVPNHGGRPS